MGAPYSQCTILQLHKLMMFCSLIDLNEIWLYDTKYLMQLAAVVTYVRHIPKCLISAAKLHKQLKVNLSLSSHVILWL
jgi:hypothetical protein